MKTRLIISIFGISIFILTGVLLPMRVFAQDAYEKIYASVESDCKKFAAQFGEKVPESLAIGGHKIDTYSVGCGFSKEDFSGYASQQIEDIQININGVGFSRYSSPESARNSIRNSIKYYESKQKAMDNKDFVITVRETPDGYVYILKGYLVFGWPELRKTHTAEISINRGTCRVSVTARSRYKDKDPGYHVSDPETGGDINRHPEFNHDREEEILALARKKAEEIFSVLDCGNGASSPSSTSPAVTISITPVGNQAPQDSYANCSWSCADQAEAKSQCSSILLLPSKDTCTEDKIGQFASCQNSCWNQWGSPPEPRLNERGPQIQKIERNGKTALLVVGNDLSKPSDSAMEQMKERLAEWNPDSSQLNMSIKAPDVPLGLGVLSLDGNDIDIKRPGSNAWETLRKGTPIPEGSKIFTGIDSNVWIYGKFGIANISHGSYVTITRDSASQGNDPNVRFDIQAGKVEIRYEKANYHGIIQTRTPSAIAQVKGTKFFTSYNQEQRYSAVGVYEGQVEVQSLITDDKIELSSDSNGESNLVFIPLQKPKEESEQEPVAVKQEVQKQKSNSGIIVSAIVILGLIMTLFILHKKGKLKPLYEKYKISELMKKIGKTGKEEKN